MTTTHADLILKPHSAITIVEKPTSHSQEKRLIQHADIRRRTDRISYANFPQSPDTSFIDDLLGILNQHVKMHRSNLT